MLLFNGFSVSNDTSIKFDTNIPKRDIKPLQRLFYHISNIIHKMFNKLEHIKYILMYLGFLTIVILTIKNYFEL
mgnify:CR=1 FL=1